MKIMSVNAGSSSLKFKIIEMPSEELISSGLVERIGLDDALIKLKNGKGEVLISKVLPIPNHEEAVALVVKYLIETKVLVSLDELQGIGHRVVQGGEVFKHSCLVNDKVISQIENLSDLAPLHNPAHIVGIKAFKKVLPDVKQVVCFDTVFHQTMDQITYTYALPKNYYTDYKIRKYGAHGISYKYIAYKLKEHFGSNKNLIVCHLGNGASICAIQKGKCIDTSMGLTPLEGIPMGTRSGNIDPTVVQYISHKESLTVDEVINVLNKKSGYLGLSQVSNDSRDIEAEYNKQNPDAILTLKVQAKRIADYIGSYYLRLGKFVLVFTAGIGENSSLLRNLVVDNLKVLKAELDQDLNNSTHGVFKEISSAKSKIKILVVPTDEELMIAKDSYQLIKQ
jgi:acetate kinase